MYNKKLYALVYLAFLFSTVFGKIMTKDEVLKIKPDDYKDKSKEQCPELSNGDYWYGRCGFEFYCKDDKVCSSAIRSGHSNSTVEFPDTNGNMKKYIVDICDPQKQSDCDYFALKCNSDGDCLSNKCENNYCVRNDNAKIEKCQDIYRYHTLIFSSTIEMKCGKPDGYPCEKNGDCASDTCIDNVCKYQSSDHKFDMVGSMLLYLCIFIILMVICCISTCIYCCRLRSKKNSKTINVNEASNSV